MTAIDDAVAEAVAAISGASLERSDAKPLIVTDFMPLPGKQDQPESVAVYFDGLTETEFGVTVTVLCSTASDVKHAEAARRRLVPAIDVALDDVPAPRSSWRKTWSPEYNAYVDETALAWPREDF